MAQFGRPNSDIGLGNWKDQGGGTTNIYQAIDEVVASDTDYVKSGSSPSADIYETRLTTLTDPLTSTGHTVRYRARKDTAGGGQINLTVYLIQNVTQIASWTETNLSESWADFSHNLTAGEADAITDYTNLRLRFSATQV